jgi:restriction system protein
MAIPYYQTIMLPLLKLLGDKNEHSLRESINKLSTEFKLTENEKIQLLPSGKQPIFDNRVGWARTYLKKAGLIESTRWGFFRITERGINLLSQNPHIIDDAMLNVYPEFKQFTSYYHEKKPTIKDNQYETITPEEELENGYRKLANNLANELLQQVKNVSPSQFENIVVALIVAMGYGGSPKDAKQAIAIGGVGDEGIDGIISQDKLGLDRIYIQAKRWQNVTVGRPEVQKFAGALQGKHASKGIFMTTSYFTKEAQDFAKVIDNRIVLIDGNQLAELMIENDVGVNTVTTYKVKKIDSDYFIEE